VQYFAHSFATCQVLNTIARYATVLKRTVLLHGRASARRMIMQDWMHSCDAASVMDTAPMTFRRPVNCLLQLINLCNSMYSGRCCWRRPITVTSYAHASTYDRQPKTLYISMTVCLFSECCTKSIINFYHVFYSLHLFIVFLCAYTCCDMFT